MKLLSIALLSLFAVSPGATVAPPPASTDWSQTVVATPEGGFRMGNPDAPVKLIEFVSMSCPHCASFDAEAHDSLVGNYVKPGRVSLEIRNFVRDPFDMAAALVARCGGPKRFFPLTRRLLADQGRWAAKLNEMSPSEGEAIQAQAPEQQFQSIADLAGFPQAAEAEGLAVSQTKACLADTKSIEQLVSMNAAATQNYPIRGVPSFIVNGELIEGADWAAVEAKLKPAN